MQYQKLADTFLLRLDTDEDVFAAVTKFAADQRIDTGMATGIGSVHHAVIGYYDREKKEYVRRLVEADSEMVSLAGNISLKDGRAFPHLHVTLGTRDFQALAGHLFEAKVAATCELFIRPLPGAVQRRLDPATGLSLLDV